MQARTFLSILFTIMLFAGVSGCNGSSSDSSDSSFQSSSNDSDSADNDSSDDSNIPDDTTPATEYAVTINFTANTAQISGGTAQAITTDGVVLVTDDGTAVSVQTAAYGITITSTVDAMVTYTLTGALNGTLTIESDSVYQLNLNGVAITASAGPALDLESARKVFIVAGSGTTNTLADSATRSLKLKAALYGNGPMIFSGAGTISVTASYKHGIFSNDYIHLKGGTLTVNVSAKDAVRSVNGFIFDDGDLTINATGTTRDDESKGIKVEGDDDTVNGAGKGSVVINGGTLTITSVGKAITAGWDIDEDLGDNTSGNPDPYVEINGGAIDITTTGTPYEDTTTGESCSPEGIEGKSRVTITGGTIVIDATEDAINAGDAINISGGYIYAKSTGNDVDAFDSNGDITISGGVIVAVASNGGTCNAFDKGDDAGSTFSITGGTVVGIGGVTCQPTSSACTQNIVVLGSLTAGSAMALKAADGTAVCAFAIPQSYATMVISAPDIVTGAKYDIYNGGTASGDDSFFGLFLGGLNYSGGSSSSSFTVSSRVTQLGGSYF